MYFSESARRISQVPQTEIDKRFDDLSVYYCAECASKHKLPIQIRVITENRNQSCFVCNEERTMMGTLMKDNHLLNGINNGKDSEGTF